MTFLLLMIQGGKYFFDAKKRRAKTFLCILLFQKLVLYIQRNSTTRFLDLRIGIITSSRMRTTVSS